MVRYTKKNPQGGYAVDTKISKEETIDRLAAFENTYEALTENIADLEKKLADLKQQGKTNSATFRQLLCKKVNYDNLRTFFSIHGVE